MMSSSAGNMTRLYEVRIRETWGRLTSADLQAVEDGFDELAARIQARYVLERVEAVRQVDDFVREQASRRPAVRVAGGL